MTIINDKLALFKRNFSTPVYIHTLQIPPLPPQVALKKSMIALEFKIIAYATIDQLKSSHQATKFGAFNYTTLSEPLFAISTKCDLTKSAQPNDFISFFNRKQRSLLGCQPGKQIVKIN